MVLVMARTERTETEKAQGKRLIQSLVRARLGAERTQAEVARSADVALDTLRSLERRPPADPGFVLVAKVARVLGVPLDDLIGEVLDDAS
jgi:DNA-binding XRE family transcriptional regulator